MVLMPCGRCCCVAGAPFESLGNPTSIEVDLSQGTSHSYSVSGDVDPSSYYGSSFSGTASLPSFSGTYSLSLTATNHWEYEDSKVWIAFDRVAGSSPSQSLAVVPKVALTGSHTIYLGTTTPTAAGGTGASVSRDCSSSFANRYGSTAYERILLGGTWYPSATSEIVSGEGYGKRFGNLGSGSNVYGSWYWHGHYAEKPRVGAYAVDLRLPFTVTSRAGILLQRSWGSAYTQTANTFPFVSTPTPIVLNDRYALYSFEYVFSIDAVRLVYASLTVDHFNTAFPTAAGFSYT
jgi:hypothetical protein